MPSAFKEIIITSSPTSFSTTSETSDVPLPSAFEETTEQYDVVIIGAGWSGLKAAQTLISNGASNILVLEANEYVGGRSKSVNADGSINTGVGNYSNVPLDLGSEWMYLGTDHEEEIHARGFTDGIDFDSKRDDWLSIELGYAQIYKQTASSDGSVDTSALPDSEAEDLMKRVWGGFRDFRRSENHRSDEDQSYASEHGLI